MPTTTRKEVIECYAHTYATEEAKRVGVHNFYEAVRAMRTQRAKSMGSPKQFTQMTSDMLALCASLAMIFGSLDMSDGGSAASDLKKQLRAAGWKSQKGCTPRHIKTLILAELDCLRPTNNVLAKHLQAIDTWLKLAMTPGIVTRAECFRNVSSFARAARQLVDPDAVAARLCSSQIKSASKRAAPQKSEPCA